MMKPDRGSAPATDAHLAPTALLALRVWIVVGAIVIGSAILNVFDVLAPVVEFLAVGSLVAFVASPIVNVLERKGIPRSVGALAGLVVVVAAVVCICMVMVPMVFQQLFELFSRLPQQLRGLGDWIVGLSGEFEMLSGLSWANDLDKVLSSLADFASTYIMPLASDLGRGVFPLISDVSSQLFIIFLSLVLAYWLACDYPRIHREVCTIVGEERETSYRFMVAILSRSVGGYMRGQVITSVIAGVLAFVGFALVSHPYAGLMGVLTGVLHLIPVIGPVISAALATLVALFYGPALAVWTLVVAMVAQNVTDNVLSPKIMQSAVSVHPAMSLAAIVVGSALMGALGMVIAIPLCAALKGLFIFYFEKGTHRQLVSYDGAIFQGTPFFDEKGQAVPAYDALGDDSFVSDSELISDEAAPAAEAAPRPELDNPWSRIASLQQGTGVFRNPFASADGPAHAAERDPREDSRDLAAERDAKGPGEDPAGDDRP